MSRQNPGSRRSQTSAGCRQADPWPPWHSERFDDELRIVVISVEQIKDPAKRAWQAGRMIELHTRLSDIRTEAVGVMRERGHSWSDIAWWLGVSRGRAWRIGQPKKRMPGS